MNNWLNKTACFLIFFSLAACSKKEHVIENNTEVKREPVEQRYIIADNNSMENIDITKIIQSAVWNTDQNKIDELTEKFDGNKLTEEEKEYIKVFYNEFIEFGGILYPEAAIILKHYLYGDGSDIIIKSDYFFQSDIIKNELEKNGNKETAGPIIIRTNDDPRIGYTINGFYIKNTQEDMEIYQYIEFGGRDNKEAYTPIKIPVKDNIINVPHRLIRIFEENGGCKGFTVRIIKENGNG